MVEMLGFYLSKTSLESESGDFAVYKGNSCVSKTKIGFRKIKDIFQHTMFFVFIFMNQKVSIPHKLIFFTQTASHELEYYIAFKNFGLIARGQVFVIYTNLATNLFM